MSKDSSKKTPTRGAGKIVLPALALLYGLVAAALRLSGGESSTIGAVCGNECGGTQLLGVPLEFFGVALMIAVVAVWSVWLRRPSASAAAALGSLALIHAGASAALAVSQWIGVAPVCALCQIAALLSVAIAVAALVSCHRELPAAAIISTQGLAVGALAVVALWPVMQSEDSEPAGTARVLPPIEAASPQQSPNGVVGQPPSAGFASDVLSLGSPDAPYTLIVLADFSCKVCERFERLVLPVLKEKAIESGQLRVRFVFKTAGRDEQRDQMALLAATSAALAGAPVEEVLLRLRAINLVSVPQAEKALEAITPGDFRTEVNAVDWPIVYSAHQGLSDLLRKKYFEGKSGTPAFVLIGGVLDTSNLPPAEEVYSFYGYQIEKPFLEFMGIAADS